MTAVVAQASVSVRGTVERIGQACKSSLMACMNLNEERKTFQLRQAWTILGGLGASLLEESIGNEELNRPGFSLEEREQVIRDLRLITASFQDHLLLQSPNDPIHYILNVLIPALQKHNA